MTRQQRADLRTLIERADACARTAKGEFLKCVRDIRKEILFQTQERNLARSAQARDEVIKMAQRRIDRLTKRLDRLMDAQYEGAARQGTAEVGRELGMTVKYSPEHAEAIIEAVRARGGASMAATFTGSMSRNLTTALRNATVAAFNEQAISGMTQRELARVIAEKWQAAAKNSENFSFVDRRGKVWDTETYMMMNVRTNSMAIYNDNMVDTITRTTGSDLVRISDDGGADSCDVCQEWSGKIVSITGKTEGFPTLDEAKADGLFHPNCVHTIETVDEELDADEIEAQRR